MSCSESCAVATGPAGGGSRFLSGARQRLRLGLAAMVCLHAGAQAVSAALVRAGDGAVDVSARGPSTDLLASVDQAHEAGGEVIAHTALASPLAARGSAALEQDMEVTAGSCAPKGPRLAQLALADMLAAGVALRQNPQRRARPQRNSDCLRGRRARHRIGPAQDTHDAQGNQALRTRR